MAKKTDVVESGAVGTVAKVDKTTIVYPRNPAEVRALALELGIEVGSRGVLPWQAVIVAAFEQLGVEVSPRLYDPKGGVVKVARIEKPKTDKVYRVTGVQRTNEFNDDGSAKDINHDVTVTLAQVQSYRKGKAGKPSGDSILRAAAEVHNWDLSQFDQHRFTVGQVVVMDDNA